MHGFSTCVDPTLNLIPACFRIYIYPVSILIPLIAVFFSYAVITADSAVLFVQEDQFTEDIRNALGTTIQVRSYDTFFEYLRTLPSTLELNEASV